MFGTTPHLNLRAYRKSDSDLFLAMNNDVRIKKGSSFEEEKGKEQEQEDLVVGFCGGGVSIKKNRDMQLGIALRPCWWGKGFGEEILRWMVDYAFEQLDMHRVSLEVSASNERATALYKKIGFVEEGRKRKAIFMDRTWVDMVSMGIVVDDWEASRKE